MTTATEYKTESLEEVIQDQEKTKWMDYDFIDNPQEAKRKERSRNLRYRFEAKVRDATCSYPQITLIPGYERDEENLLGKPLRKADQNVPAAVPQTDYSSVEYLKRKRRQYMTDLMNVLEKLIACKDDDSSAMYWSKLRFSIKKIYHFFYERESEQVFLQIVAVTENSTLGEGWKSYSPERLRVIIDAIQNLYEKRQLGMKDFLDYLDVLAKHDISTSPAAEVEE